MNNKLSIIVIGDMNVGKTHLLAQLTQQSKDIVSTIGIDFIHRSYVLYNNIVKVHIWDTADQERFRAITQSYYRSADGAMIVFDLTNIMTFDNVKYWLQDIIRKCSKHIPIIIVGHKKDLLSERCISYQTAADFAEQYNCHYFETSISDSDSINTAFYDLILQAYKSPSSNSDSLSSTSSTSICHC